MEKKKTTVLEMRAFLKLFFISLSLEACGKIFKTQSVMARINDIPLIERMVSMDDLFNYLASFLWRVQTYGMPSFDARYSDAVLLGTAVNGLSVSFLAELDHGNKAPGLFDELFRGAADHKCVNLLFYILSETSYSLEAGEAGWSLERNRNLRLQMDFRKEKSACYGEGSHFIESSLRDFFGWGGEDLSSWPSEEEIKKIDLTEALRKVKRNALEG